MLHLHREDQILENPCKYDIVRAKKQIKAVAGTMNSYSKQIEFKAFEGYGIITGISESFATVYMPNRTRKLFKKSNLVVTIKYKIKQ